MEIHTDYIEENYEKIHRLIDIGPKTLKNKDKEIFIFAIRRQIGMANMARCLDMSL